MKQLNEQAFDILKAEIKRRVNRHPAEKTLGGLLRRRLDRLCLTSGTPLDEAALRQVVQRIMPDFDPQVLKRAARANQHQNLFSTIGSDGFLWLGGGLGALCALIAVANLPYPMIRRPVAEVAPIVLLPSFVGMDHNYREAIVNVEQADQLINQATSHLDIAKGSEHVTAAQAALDKLPVWFLGYAPVGYCSWFSCAWRFTFDEFEAARKAIARMEAKGFQETHAQTEFDAALAEFNQAKQAYDQATTSIQKEQALQAQNAVF